MSAPQRNRRRNAPRPVRVERRGRLARAHDVRLGHPYRFGLTPTPPPVSIDAAPLPRREPGSGGGRRRLRTTLTVLAMLAALALLAYRAVTARQELQGRLTPPASRAEAPAVSPPEASAAPGPPVLADSAASSREALHRAWDGEGRPDERLAVGDRVRLGSGAVLMAPRSLVTADGAYDLLVHFHGDPGHVLAGVEGVGVNAVVAAVHLGEGSEVYRRHFASARDYDTLLERVVRAAGRGPRRIALSGFSAGYGAVAAILAARGGHDPLDAVLLIDGPYADRDALAAGEALAPFARFAAEAARGDRLLAMTHSAIRPPRYAGPAEIAEHLAVGVGATLHPIGEDRARWAAFEAFGLVATHDTAVGWLRIHGFRGLDGRAHAMQLQHVGATVLPDLAERWASNIPSRVASRAR